MDNNNNSDSINTNNDYFDNEEIIDRDMDKDERIEDNNLEEYDEDLLIIDEKEKKLKELLINKKKKKGIVREIIEAIVFLILVSILIRIFLIEAYTIPSASMRTSFMEGYYNFEKGEFINLGDRLIASKFLYGIRIPVINISLPGITSPNRGDIIIFEHPEFQSPGWEWELLNLLTLGIFRIDNNKNSPRILVKRCMAGPGDTIIIDSDKDIYINGDKLKKERVKPELEEELNQYNYPEEMKIYQETNGNNQYIIQEEADYNYNNSTPTYYIPKKGDELSITRIKTEYGKKYKYMINDLEIDEEAWHIYNLAMSEEMGIDFTNLEKDSYSHIIKHDYYFGMGDNRDNSRDSRYWGIIRDELVFGSPLFIFFPFNRIGIVD